MSFQNEIIVNVADTETTGFKPPPEGDIVEIAVTPTRFIFDEAGKLIDVRVGATVAQLANPGVPIHLEAMAVHHITEVMVKHERPAKEVKAEFAALPCDYWAFHNAAFDLKFFQPQAPVICTLKAAQAIFPNAPSHKNMVLRYWLQLDRMMKADRLGDAHRAGFDSYVTACLLARLMQENKMSLGDMAGLQGSPIHMGNIAFGKHRGTPWSQVPKSYLLWLKDNTQDEQVLASCKHYLKTAR